MSSEELLGKYAEQYKEASETLKQNQSEAKHWGELLRNLSAYLLGLSGTQSPQPDLSQLASFPTKEVLTQLLTDMGASAQQKQSAHEELDRLGLSVK